LPRPLFRLRYDAERLLGFVDFAADAASLGEGFDFVGGD
jgi:hypothetical protein